MKGPRISSAGYQRVKPELWRLEVRLDRCLRVTKVPLSYPVSAFRGIHVILRRLPSPRRCVFSCPPSERKRKVMGVRPLLSCGSSALCKSSPQSKLLSRVFLLVFCFVVAATFTYEAGTEPSGWRVQGWLPSPPSYNEAAEALENTPRAIAPSRRILAVC